MVWRAAGARSRADRDEALSEQLASERWQARLREAVSDVAPLSAGSDQDPGALFAVVCERAADLLGGDRRVRACMAEAGLRSAVAAPVGVHGGLWGCIVAVSARPRGFRATTERLLERFAALVSVAL